MGRGGAKSKPTNNAGKAQVEEAKSKPELDATSDQDEESEEDRSFNSQVEVNEADGEKIVSDDRDILIESYQTPPVVSKKACAEDETGVSASDPGLALDSSSRKSLTEKSTNNEDGAAAG